MSSAISHLFVLVDKIYLIVAVIISCQKVKVVSEQNQYYLTTLY